MRGAWRQLSGLAKAGYLAAIVLTVMTVAAGLELEQVQAEQAERWAGRFADLLDEDPGLEGELRALVEEIRAQLPTDGSRATDHSVAAGANVNIRASTWGTAAGVIHGDVALGNPTGPGPGQP